MTALGSMIERRMADLGINQNQFARFCDLSESQISLLRSGNRKARKMQIGTAGKLARGLGIGVEVLLAQVETTEAATA